MVQSLQFLLFLCIKKYLHSVFKFYTETFGTLKKNDGLVIFLFNVYAYLSGSSDVICVGTDLGFTGFGK